MNEVDHLIEKFIQSVMIHRTQSENGDYEIANKHFKIAEMCFCKLREQNDNWVDEFLKLLNHDESSVRVSAAYYLLPFETHKAINILKKSKKEPNGVGFNAKIVLKEWKKGHLKFPVLSDGKVIYIDHTDIK